VPPLPGCGAIALAYDMIGYEEADHVSYTHPQALTPNNNSPRVKAVDFLLPCPK